MKVSGFTFARDGVLLGYPFVESIKSALPICDEFIVALGESQDDTRKQIESIDSNKIRIVDTQWNEAMLNKGFVYAQQKMIGLFNCTGDWAFYLEGDEVLHENDLDTILASMRDNLEHTEVEALIFDYYHFYGHPQQIAISPGWYRRAPRIIRNTIRSIAPDGLYFVVLDKNKRGRYPRAALANAPIYHYGHVRPASKMSAKINAVSKYWGHKPPSFNHYGNIDAQALTSFTGTHPAVIQDWLESEAEHEFSLNSDYVISRRERRHRKMMKLEALFNLELSKKHYKLVR